jgi:hypothetical protein
MESSLFAGQELGRQLELLWGGLKLLLLGLQLGRLDGILWAVLLDKGSLFLASLDAGIGPLVAAQKTFVTAGLWSLSQVNEIVDPSLVQLAGNIDLCLDGRGCSVGLDLLGWMLGKVGLNLFNDTSGRNQIGN